MQLYLFTALVFLTCAWAWIVFCGEEFESTPQGLGVLFMLSLSSLCWPFLVIVMLYVMVVDE